MTTTTDRPGPASLARPHRTGRRPLTDRATLLAAAEEIGIRQLTIGAVTAKVGVKYATYYRHWPSLAALVDAVAETVLERAPWPSAEVKPWPWRVHLEYLNDAVHEAVKQDPGVGDLIRSRPAGSWPKPLCTAVVTAVGVLADAGYHWDDVGTVVIAVIDAAARLHDDKPGFFASMQAVSLLCDGAAARLGEVVER